MNIRLKPLRRLGRREDGSAIIEFALVVPILFMVVWAIISFSRAYQRLNALTASLREGARYAATVPIPISTADSSAAVTRVTSFASAYGFTIPAGTIQVVQQTTGVITEVHVRAVNYALFSGLNFIGALQSITISRDAVFRLEQG